MTPNNRFSQNVSGFINKDSRSSSVTTCRRLFLKKTLSSATITLAVSSGILLPMHAMASWNKAAFVADNLQTAIKSTLGSDLSEASNKISIEAPAIVENGAVVPISISSSLENVSTITLFSEQNETPLIAQFELDKNCNAYISTRIKLSKTSNVIAIVSANGKNYSTRQKVNVTIGGCGG